MTGADAAATARTGPSSQAGCREARLAQAAFGGSVPGGADRHPALAAGWHSAPLVGLGSDEAAQANFQKSAKSSSKRKRLPARKSGPRSAAKAPHKPQLAYEPGSVPSSLCRFLDSRAVTWRGSSCDRSRAAGPGATDTEKDEHLSHGPWFFRVPATHAVCFAAMHDAFSPLHSAEQARAATRDVAAIAATGVPCMVSQATRSEMSVALRTVQRCSRVVHVADTLAAETRPCSGRLYEAGTEEMFSHGDTLSEMGLSWPIRGARTLALADELGPIASVEHLSDVTGAVGVPNALSLVLQGPAPQAPVELRELQSILEARRVTLSKTPTLRCAAALVPINRLCSPVEATPSDKSPPASSAGPGSPETPSRAVSVLLRQWRDERFPGAHTLPGGMDPRETEWMLKVASASQLGDQPFQGVLAGACTSPSVALLSMGPESPEACAAVAQSALEACDIEIALDSL